MITLLQDIQGTNTTVAPLDFDITKAFQHPIGLITTQYGEPQRVVGQFKNDRATAVMLGLKARLDVLGQSEAKPTAEV